MNEENRFKDVVDGVAKKVAGKRRKRQNTRTEKPLKAPTQETASEQEGFLSRESMLLREATISNIASRNDLLRIFSEAMSEAGHERQMQTIMAKRKNIPAATETGHRIVDPFTQAEMHWMGTLAPEAPRSGTRAKIHAFPQAKPFGMER